MITIIAVTLEGLANVSSIAVAVIALLALGPAVHEGWQRVRLRRIDVALTLGAQYHDALASLSTTDLPSVSEDERSELIRILDKAGYLVRIRQLDENLAWQYFCSPVGDLMKLEGDRVRAMQASQEDPTIWEDFFWLSDFLDAYDEMMVGRRIRRPLKIGWRRRIRLNRW